MCIRPHVCICTLMKKQSNSQDSHQAISSSLLSEAFTVLMDFQFFLQNKFQTSLKLFYNKNNFLGYEIGYKTIKPIHSKIAVSHKIPSPTRKVALLSFFGALNFYNKFIETLQINLNSEYKTYIFITVEASFRRSHFPIKRR